MMNIDFSYLNAPKDNFIKCADIASQLLWDDGDWNNVALPYITILIITNNRVELLKEALFSAIRQEDVSFKWEIVIASNSDDYAAELKMVEDIHFDRIRYYHHNQNLGHEGNINRGITLARGEWVAVLHDDDLLVKNYLVLINKYIDACSGWNRPLAYVRAKYEMFKDGDAIDLNEAVDNTIERLIRPEKLVESLLRGNGPTYVNSCGSLINRKAFIEIGGYNDELNPIADATLGLIMMNNGYSIYSAERVLGFYRQGNNVSTKKNTVVALIKADYYLREYMYSLNSLYALFGFLFRRAQLVQSIENKNKVLSKYLGYSGEQLVVMSDVSELTKKKSKRFSLAILKAVRVVFYLLVKPSRIISHFCDRRM